MAESFVLKGDICHAQGPGSLHTVRNGWLVCENGLSAGVFDTLPDRCRELPLVDRSGKLVVPGLTDLHMHAPQYAFRSLGMDLELLEWLNTRTFPEEAKYADADYAEKAYGALVRDLVDGPNTRLAVYATIHAPATTMFMEMLERSGLVSLVGKVSMDRNCPENLSESDAATAARAVRGWLEDAGGRFENTRPIVTPRFIPACSDELLRQLADIRREYGLPVQSHLSENKSEIEWVRKLCPGSENYADAYRAFDLLGGDAPTVMAHCVWSGEDEIRLLRDRGVFVAHCPQSNINLASGIAPARKFLDAGARIGLGSDMAAGCHLSIFRAMADAVQASKLRWRLIDSNDKPLTVEEAFWLGTAGGGAFFGKVGKFDPGYEFDALVIDDSSLAPPFGIDIPERLARVVYLSDDRHIAEKYVRGKRVK